MWNQCRGSTGAYLLTRVEDCSEVDMLDVWYKSTLEQKRNPYSATDQQERLLLNSGLN